MGEQRIQQARLQTLKSKFEMLQMKEDETIDTFTGKLTILANKAASLGHTFEDPTLVKKLFNVVPEKFLQIVASIEQYSDLDKMSVEEPIRRLKTFKERIKVKKGKAFEDQDKLLFAKHNDNGQRHHYDNQGEGRYIPPHNQNRDENRQHGKEESFSQDYNKEMKKPRDFSNIKWAGTSGGVFGNQRQSSGSQTVVSQADMVGSQAFGSKVDMVGSQAFGSQTNGIGTQTSVAGRGNMVNSVQGGATTHAHTNVGTCSEWEMSKD
nr:zinc finger, CCHC-type [Tanacetum cinerariifolium]